MRTKTHLDVFPRYRNGPVGVVVAAWHQARRLSWVAEKERVHSGPQQYRARLVPYDPEKPDALRVAWLRRVFTTDSKCLARREHTAGGKQKKREGVWKPKPYGSNFVRLCV